MKYHALHGEQALGLWQSLLPSCKGGKVQAALAELMHPQWLCTVKENIRSATQGQISIPVFIT